MIALWLWLGGMAPTLVWWSAIMAQGYRKTEDEAFNLWDPAGMFIAVVFMLCWPILLLALLGSWIGDRGKK